MSLPVFDPQTHLFGLQARSSDVFSETDRYRLFAQKIYPLLVESRPRLEACYCLTNGRPGVEPVLLLGVSGLQFLERVPDRQAVELVKYHIGWKHALAQELEGEVFDPTVLVRFRERLLERAQGQVAFEAVLGGLKQAGLVKQKGKQWTRPTCWRWWRGWARWSACGKACGWRWTSWRVKWEKRNGPSFGIGCGSGMWTASPTTKPRPRR